MTTTIEKTENKNEIQAYVHCYICSHTSKAVVTSNKRNASVKAGEKCDRCGSSLGAAVVLRLA